VKDSFGFLVLVIFAFWFAWWVLHWILIALLPYTDFVVQILGITFWGGLIVIAVVFIFIWIRSRRVQ
jgi:hypothetical protein